MQRSWSGQREEDPSVYVDGGIGLTLCDRSRFRRPELAEFHDERSEVFLQEAEFVRWYLQDGTPRERPLALDELIVELQGLNGWPFDVAEWTAIFDSRARYDDVELWSLHVETSAASCSMPAVSKH